MDKALEANEEMKKEFSDKLNDIEKTSEIEGIVKDNKLIFKAGADLYRLRKASFLEKQEIDAFRRKHYLAFLKDETMLFRKDLTKLLKEKGVDIDLIEKQIKESQNSIDNLLLILAQTTIEQEIKDLKINILALKKEQSDLYIEKSDALAYCIEEQLLSAQMVYYAYLVCEKQVEGNWVKAFKNYEEFTQSDNSQLIDKMIYYISYLIYSE